MVKSREARSRRLTISEQQETQSTPIRDNINYRRHRGACPFYRENWSLEADPNGSGEQMLYQIICLQDTPPVTREEQHLCLHSPHRCWRLEFAERRNGRNGAGSADGQEDLEDSEDCCEETTEDCLTGHAKANGKANGREKANCREKPKKRTKAPAGASE